MIGPVPLIRCPKCQQAYDVPGAVAVRLPSSIATCHCGEWLAGSKAAVLARLLNPEEIREIDLQQYRVTVDASTGSPVPSWAPSVAHPDDETIVHSKPRSLRVIARGAGEAVDTVFTIGAHPLWIGRKDCHVQITDAELSIRHCSIALRNGRLVVRDADSHTGTFLDGQQVDEAQIADGIHLLRAGSALLTIEPVEGPGLAVERMALRDGDDSMRDLLQSRAEARQDAAEGGRMLLVCVEGPLSGQEFEIPPGGLVVGREGHVAIPDEFLSRRHFEVGPDDDGQVRVRDLGSRNGTFLNTLPARNTKVHKGDEIRAGLNAFRIEQRS